MSRRYHGLRIDAIQPPVWRTHLVASRDETVRYGSEGFALATHRWASGAVEPKGFQHIEAFHLDGLTPVWTYALADAGLEKRLGMRQGADTTYVQHSGTQGRGALWSAREATATY